MLLSIILGNMYIQVSFFKVGMYHNSNIWIYTIPPKKLIKYMQMYKCTQYTNAKVNLPTCFSVTHKLSFYLYQTSSLHGMLCFQVIIFAIKKIQKSKKWVPSTKIHIHKYKTTSNTCNMYENGNKLCIVLIYVTSKCA